jgi:hypothetical protein
MAPRAIEHGAELYSTAAPSLRRQDERDVVTRAVSTSGAVNRIWQLQEEVLVVRPQLVGKEWRQEQLGKADDVASLLLPRPSTIPHATSTPGRMSSPSTGPV